MGLSVISHGYRRYLPEETRGGFALLPVLVLLVLLSSIATVLSIEAISATRTAAAAQQGRHFDLDERARAFAAPPRGASTPISIEPESTSFKKIYFSETASGVQGIPRFSLIDSSNVTCSFGQGDRLSNRVCSILPPREGPLTSISGGLHATYVTVPEGTRNLYVRGDVEVGTLTIQGSHLTLSALGRIRIDAVDSPRNPAPSLLLISQQRQYRLPLAQPNGGIVTTAESSIAVTLLDKKIFPQRESTLIGMIFSHDLR